MEDLQCKNVQSVSWRLEIWCKSLLWEQSLHLVSTYCFVVGCLSIKPAAWSDKRVRNDHRLGLIDKPAFTLSSHGSRNNGPRDQRHLWVNCRVEGVQQKVSFEWTRGNIWFNVSSQLNNIKNSSLVVLRHFDEEIFHIISLRTEFCFVYNRTLIRHFSVSCSADCCSLFFCLSSCPFKAESKWDGMIHGAH